MKKALLTLAVSILAVGAHAQGTVNFANFGGIFTAANAPYVMNGVTGARAASGTEFWVQLYYASGADQAESALGPVANAPIRFATPGVFVGSRRDLNVTPAGGPATLQVRAWSSVLGDSYDAAFIAWSSGPAADNRLLGKSALFTVDTSDPGNVQEQPAPLKGLTSFSVVPVPEPSTIALGLLGGLGALVLFRRRK
jgi:hypothetical protein